ncbi:MAG: TetR/AcrR family transcriptional regulator [bacterium]|nr:TetR/AcrR family transcriptional regulator [bacterium]
MTTPATSKAQRGRPRDPRIQQSILQATREILDEVGYSRLTIEGVAARAGAGKATVYRWWSTKGELVLEAVADHIAIGVVSDTGDTRGDLLIATQQLIETFSDRLAGIVIFAAIANLDDDPNMARIFRETAVMPWRQSAVEAIQRGIDRGDLPADTDIVFTLDVIVGTVFQRTLVVAQPQTEGLSRSIIDLLIASS